MSRLNSLNWMKQSNCWGVVFMKKKWFIFGITGIILFFIGFNITSELIGKKSNDNYHIGMPEELDEGLIDFLLRESIPINARLVDKNNQYYVFSLFNDEAKPMKMEYYTISNEQLLDYFSPILRSKEPDRTLRNFRTNFEKELFKAPNTRYEDYPGITVQEDNVLTVVTDEGEKTFDLVERLNAYNVGLEDELSLEIQSANEHSFEVYIENYNVEDQNRFLRIYMNQDLSNFTAVIAYNEYFNESLVDGTLDDFKNLVFNRELNDRYTLMSDQLRMFDHQNDTTVMINEGSDYISDDRKYVYVNGNDVDSRNNQKHRIQRIEDYLEGNNEYYSQFEFDYEEMSDHLGIDSVGAGEVKVLYLSEDYAVLQVRFAGAITGSPGSTNVILDFKENPEDPAIYLIDLGLLINTHIPL